MGGGRSPGVGDVRSCQQLVGGAVCVSSCQHTDICNSLGHSCNLIPHPKRRGISQFNLNKSMHQGITELCFEKKIMRKLD